MLVNACHENVLHFLLVRGCTLLLKFDIQIFACKLAVFN